MPDTPRLLFRPVAESELKLVLSGWLRTMRADVRMRKPDLYHVPQEVFWEGERLRATRLLEAHGATVAVLPEVPDEVLGWACVGPASVLHYACTKPEYQGRGVFHAIGVHVGLMRGHFEATTLTRAVLEWRARGRPVTYNPYR